MLGKDISFESPEENILFDELLLQLAEEGKLPETLRFWESSITFIVLGRISKAAEDLNLEAIRKDRIKVLRRGSGGGTVLQGKGVLNFALVLSKDRPQVHDLKKSYQYILGKCVEALGELQIKASFHPVCDIALVDGSKKISGNAQKRGRQYILHHGTFLIDFDLRLMSRYLKMPKSVPEYRNERSHEDFVTNLGIDRVNFKKVMMKVFGAETRTSKWSPEEQARLREMVEKGIREV